MNCFNLFRIKMILIRSKLVHHVEISIFKCWIVVFNKNDRIKKFRWSLICNDEWRKRFLKFSTKSRQISFERHIFTLFFRKNFFQFMNFFLIYYHFFLKWDDFSRKRFLSFFAIKQRFYVLMTIWKVFFCFSFNYFQLFTVRSSCVSTPLAHLVQERETY